MKSEQLIDLLCDTDQHTDATRHGRRTASGRSASIDSVASHTRGRVGSMIIHDLPEDEGGHDPNEDVDMADDSEVSNGEPSHIHPPGFTKSFPPPRSATRLNKAKATR